MSHKYVIKKTVLQKSRLSFCFKFHIEGGSQLQVTLYKMSMIDFNYLSLYVALFSSDETRVGRQLCRNLMTGLCGEVGRLVPLSGVFRLVRCWSVSRLVRSLENGWSQTGVRQGCQFVPPSALLQWSRTKIKYQFSSSHNFVLTSSTSL